MASYWYQVKPSYVLHWPEYGPYFGDAVGRVPGLVGRVDRVWALEGMFVEIAHDAIKWCVEGVNQQMHKLVQVDVSKVPTEDGGGPGVKKAKRDMIIHDWKTKVLPCSLAKAPPPVRKLIDEWDRRVAGKAQQTPVSAAADQVAETSSPDVPALDDGEEETPATEPETEPEPELEAETSDAP